MAEEKKSFFRKYVYDPDAGNETPAVSPEGRTFPSGAPGAVTTPSSTGPKPLLRTSRPSLAVSTPKPTAETVDNEYFNGIIQSIGELQLPTGFDQFVVLMNKRIQRGDTPDVAFQDAFETIRDLTGLTKEQVVQGLRAQQLKLANELQSSTSDFQKEATDNKKAATERQKRSSSEVGETTSQLDLLEQEYRAQKSGLETQLARQQAELEAAQRELSSIDNDLQTTIALFQSAHAAVLKGSPEHSWIGIETLLSLAGAPLTGPESKNSQKEKK